MAKAEILQASEHFSNIRAQRKGVAPPPIQPGQITKTVSTDFAPLKEHVWSKIKKAINHGKS